MAAPNLKIRKVESIADEMENIHGQVAQRAHEIFEKTFEPFHRDLDNWLAAEAELTWKPPVELSEKDDCFVVRIAIPGVNSKDLDVRVTPDDLLINAAVRHEHTEKRGAVLICEFPSGTLFRAVRFPKRINPDEVEAEFKNGMLRLTAQIANEQT